jgi:hypothetical protein
MVPSGTSRFRKIRGGRFAADGCGGAGCLTSEDEERETWTAESLRISGVELRLDVRGRTKDFDGRRFKGNTMIFAL